MYPKHSHTQLNDNDGDDNDVDHTMPWEMFQVQ